MTVKTDRATASIVGVLYIVGTVAGVLSLIVTSGLLDGPDYLTKMASHAGQARFGALVILLMPLAVQEMVMAIWLIAKGFSAGTIASDPDQRQPNRAQLVG